MDHFILRGIAPMALLSTFKRLLKGVLVPAVFLAVSGYFGWHAVHGERGLMARDKRQADITAARTELAKAEAERDAMERRVTGLRAIGLIGTSLKNAPGRF
jgi:cell division protein FtsB